MTDCTQMSPILLLAFYLSGIIVFGGLAGVLVAIAVKSVRDIARYVDGGQ